MWKYFLKPLFFLFDPEFVHNFLILFTRFFAKVGLTPLDMRVDHPSLQKKLFGINFPNSVGLAAGFDKNAEIFTSIRKLGGFGFTEIGTVTPKPQSGNPKKRIFRLTTDNALINRLGFNNDGVDAIVERLKNNRFKSLGSKLPIGANIGKNKSTPNSDAHKDYLECFKKLKPYVDYFAVNVSSPNTPDLRNLQSISFLKKILHTLILENNKENKKPILVKVSPDLSNNELSEIVSLLLDLNIDGIICSNTTVSRQKLKSENLKNEKGGLSGKPLFKRSTEMVRLIKKEAGDKLPIVAVGGIMSPNDVIEKINAGASLVQIYTGWIYYGPTLIRDINKKLIKENFKN
tara:strand:+ start:326 stop:1363 length:1038 start_codon:yes stop_codon:yes gene_type:complete